MDILLYIFAMAAAIVVMLILLAFLIGDINKAKQYRNAARVQGVICENYGVEKVASYGRNQYRKYGKYLVQFETPEGVQTQEVLMKNKNFQRGDITEVRYIIDETGVHLVDNISNTRLRELLIVVLVAVPLCIVILYLKKNHSF